MEHLWYFLDTAVQVIILNILVKWQLKTDGIYEKSSSYHLDFEHRADNFLNGLAHGNTSPMSRD